MIFVTGDIHGNPQRFSSNFFPEQKEMTKDDYVIICGDFGLVWNIIKENNTERYWLDWLEDKNFTTLFCDGNHENFDRLDAYPVKEWHGGKVHFIRPHVIHLMRGEIYDIDGKSCFVFGGARSHDINGAASRAELAENYAAGIIGMDDPEFKDKLFRMDLSGSCYRVRNVTWWEQEDPSASEIKHGFKTLKQHQNKVDFIFTHEGPTSDMKMIDSYFEINPLEKMLEQIKQTVEYKHWFFGHYHFNKQITDKDAVLYEQIIQIN